MSKNEKDIILIVEDDKTFSQLISRQLSHFFTVKIGSSKKEAEIIIETGMVHAILLDLRLQGDDSEDFEGLELLELIKSDRPLLPVIVMTSYANVPLSVKAMQIGADDFIEKGKIDIGEVKEKLLALILKKRNTLKTKALAEEHLNTYDTTIIGQSALLEEVKKSISVSAHDGYCSVLILGETGTGKEIIAKSIHEQGWRKDGPFRAITISSFNPSLIESELFGYEKGAFTGAQNNKEGYIEQSNGGVLFLDEIGDLTLELQIKLLRFLEERIVYRVGSTKPRPVDIQIIFATNCNLQKLIEESKFRQDFYFRIHTVEINIPTLRDRISDVPLLADHFLQLLRKQGRTKLAGFSDDAIDALLQYNYPGNIRELKAAVEWATLNANQAGHWIVEAEDIPKEIKKVDSVAKKTDISSFELTEGQNIEYILASTELTCVEQALKMSSGKKTKAEDLLGYPNRQTMRRRINKLRETYPDIFKNLELVNLLYGEM